MPENTVSTRICPLSVKVEKAGWGHFEPCEGTLTDYGEEPDAMLACLRCGSLWSLDSKEDLCLRK